MSLSPGTRLGPYEVAGPLGAGGMGEVYRAKDTRLGRDVALKIVPTHLSQNPEVRERFEREARAISSLNHPHICTLYDIGRDGDADYFVMELLEGESLATRLERGPLKLDEALKIAAQIADGLAAAHKQGIVHRDLKPGNIVLTRSGAKILDFGVAKLREEQVVEMATRTTPLTTAGSMVGTVQYMSPEQLEGKPVDHRSDLFAFGALLYEMVTGKRAFEGQSQASVIAAILDREPRPVSQMIPTAPEALDRIVTLCLAKDPDQRWQSAGDLARELRWIADGKTPSTSSPAPTIVAKGMKGRELIAWGVVGILLAATIILLLRPAPAVAPTMLRRFVVDSPESAMMAPDAVFSRISPDGRTLAFFASDAKGVSSLWLRPLDSLEAHALPGTQDGSLPFWSPDGRYVGYFGSGKLKKVAIDGGTPESICNVGDGRGATWSENGTIVFAPESAGAIYQVPQGGGDVRPVTALDASRKETGHRWPYFLPDGKHFLFVTMPADQGTFDVFIGSTSGPERTFLVKASGAPVYASPGWLIYPRENTLMAQRFDAAKRTLVGEPKSLGAAPAPSDWTGAAVLSASRDGVLARSAWVFKDTQLSWYDRAGHLVSEVPLPSGRYGIAAISPDGKRIVITRRTATSKSDLWLMDVDHPVPSRLTFGSVDTTNYVAWSPDGRHVAFGTDRNGPVDAYVKPVDGSSDEVPILTGGALFKSPTSWTADGRSIVYEQPDATTGWDILMVPSDGKGTPTPILQSKSAERVGVVSPDGRWIAYSSDESGRLELYVQSFPTAGSKAQVTSAGEFGSMKRWTKGGKELMFLGIDGRTVMAADVSIGATFHAGAPHELFKLRPDWTGWDFTPDGERVLVVAPAGPPQAPAIAIDLNWSAELER
ncbi:MAG TPA: protein kinase [Candidatus Polarisedimenticolaceae bacterium]|nr:protein kinase [Candidatus Polarisedimenticolaceae bacterium]